MKLLRLIFWMGCLIDKVNSGLYYKTITIVIMTIVSDATIWSVTFDAARGVIYDRNMAIPHVYGTGVICDDRQMTIVIVL
jgi:hypothetical protein